MKNYYYDLYNKSFAPTVILIPPKAGEGSRTNVRLKQVPMESRILDRVGVQRFFATLRMTTVKSVYNLVFPRLRLILGIVILIVLVNWGFRSLGIQRAEAQTTPVTSFSLQSSQTSYQIGQEIPVTVMVRSDIDAANVFSAQLNFPASNLEVVRIDTNNSFITFWTDSFFDNAIGKVSLIGAVPSPGYKTDPAQNPSLFATVVFKAKTTGSLAINFDPSSQILRNSDNNNILSTTNNITLTINQSATPTPVPATITLNPAITYQTMIGNWEATDYIGDPIDPVLPRYQDALLTQLVNDVGINRIRLEIRSGIENSQDYWTQFTTGQIDYPTWRAVRYQVVNDNSDPNNINSNGFKFAQQDWNMDNMVIPLKQKLEARGEKLFINLNYVNFSAGGTTIHVTNPQEYAEFMLATFQHMQTKYGVVPDSIEMFLEPTSTTFSGNMMGQALQATATKLSANGFNPKFVVPSTSSVYPTLDYLTAVGQVIGDPSGIQQYVQQISYHRYDGGDVSGMVKTIGDKAATYGLGGAMLEWWTPSNGYQTLHQDLTLGRNSAWQQGTLLGVLDVDTTDPNNPKIVMPDMTKFTMLYYKFIRNGAIRIDAQTANNNFDPIAFKKADGKTDNNYTVVVKAAAGGNFSIGNLPAGTYGIKYTTSPTQYNIDQPDQTITSGQNIDTNIPAAGVITIYAKSTGPATPCSLSSASWSVQNIIAGSPVGLNVQASGGCSGKQVNLQVRRNITLQPDAPAQNPVIPNPVSLSFISGNNYSATSNWVADPWLNACLIGTCDPQYFFKTNIVGETATIESNPRFVTISQAPSPTPTPTPTPSPVPTATPTPTPSQAQFVVETVVSNLTVPWALDFLPDGSILFTERPGGIRLFRSGQLYTLATLSVASGAESGLMGLAVDPNFSSNSYFYVTYAYYNSTGGIQNRVSRFTLSGTTATSETTIFDPIPGAQFHDGGRLKFGPDGKLYITTGDTVNDYLSQDPASLAGKILRINPDGSIPADNPFPGSPVYSLGHRNPQGLAFYPVSGNLYSSEHGPSPGANDEINFIIKGANYGWPIVICSDPPDPQFEEAIVCSGSETWAPAGATFYSGDLLPWKNNLFVANLRGNHLRRIVFGSDLITPVQQEVLLNTYGRLRDVVEKDGYLYVTTSNKDGRGSPAADDDKILRIRPLTLPSATPTPTTQPTPTPVPCTLNSASWSTSNVVSGTQVTMTVNGSNCAGQTASFLVRENDAGLEVPWLDEDASSQPVPNTAIFSGNTATLNWTATYMEDGLGGIFDPPEFFFNATVGTQTRRSADPLLTVTKPSGGGTPTLPNDWVMAGANPQRTSWVASTAQNQTEIPGGLRPEWYIPVEPFMHPKFQIIAAYDTIYSSTAKGLYAFDAATGASKWTYPTEMPLGNSPTIYNGVAYVGGLDHKIHAVNALTGVGLWTYEAGQGFETNPLVVNDILYVGNHDGYMYALDVTDSTNATKNRLKWRYQTGGPIRYSAAAKKDNSVIYFASDDASGYAINTSNGTLAWKQKLPGGYFGSWWPVYYSHPTEGDYVIFSGNFNHRPSLRPGLVSDWGAYNVFGKEWDDLFPTRLTQVTSLLVAPQTATSIPGDWVSGTITLDASKFSQSGSDYTTAISEYYEEPTAAQNTTDPAGLTRHAQKPWRRTYLVLNPNTGQEITYDFDNDGQKEFAPITTAYITHYSNRFPPLVGLNNVLYQQVNGSSSGIPASRFVGWKINTPYLGQVASGYNRAVDEPFALSAGGNLVYFNHCCDRTAGAFDISVLTDQSRWYYFDENNPSTVLENLAPGYNTGYIPTPNDDYQDCCGYNYWTAFGGLNGSYGKHSTQNPPIPYKGRVYMQRGNSIIAFKAGASNAVKLPTATVVSTQSQPPAVTKQDLQVKLENEISKMIQAGHLKPGFFGVGLQGYISQYASEDLFDYFHNPFDTFYTLLRVRPLITDTTLRVQLDSYLQSEWTNFNPATINHIGWQEGAWRDSNLEVIPEVTADLPNFAKTSSQLAPSNFWETWDFNPMAWYAMWMYAKEYGNAASIFTSGVNSTPLMDSFVMAMDQTVITPAELAEYSWAHNGYIAGYIGFANLYDLAVSQGMAPITGNVRAGYPYTITQLKARRDALMLQRVQNFTKKTPYPNTATGRQPRALNPSRNFIFMVPELADYLRTSTAICIDGKVALECVRDTVAQFDKITPFWFESKADLGYEESAFAPLYDYNSNFQAKAQILQQPFEELVKYLDVPAFDRGDLFYIQNLTSTLLAPTSGASPTPTPTPVPCTISSVSWPAGTTSVTEGTNVNISVTASGTCASKQVHLSVRRNIAGQPDADATNQPNPRDVSLILTGNTATASATWISDTWTNACTLTTCDPTFFVKGNIVGETNEVTSDRNNDLIVTQSVQTSPNDWPQVQKDPQHTGYSSETLGTNFQVAWRHAFQPDKVYPQVQPIIYQGKVFVGTEGANGQKPTLYAFNALNGQQVWKYEAGGSILNSVAADNNRIFFSSLDGAVYALDSSTGAQVWKNQLSKQGFSTAPVVADNKIMLGGRDGNFYGLDPNSGSVIWQYNVGAPIMQTAAFNNGKVFFGAMDMSVYALNTADGTLAWKTSRLTGLAFKDYWPMVTQGRVIVRPMEWATTSLYSIDEATGAVDSSLPQYDGNTMHGGITPPCVDRNNLLFVPMQVPGSWQSGWGRLNLSTRTATSISQDNIGAGNNDENMNTSCSNNLLLAFHTEEENANYNGFYNLDSSTWTQVPPGAVNRQMSSNTQGGGGNPASISNGRVYHISRYELIARTTN